MDVDELLAAIADRFEALGAEREGALKDLNQQARRRVSRILDKYSRFIPFDQTHNGLVLQQAATEGSAFVALVAIDTPDGPVPAAKIRFEPAAGAADEFHTRHSRS